MNKALLVGINNYPSPNQLNGCVNDVTDVANFLVSDCDFKEDDIRLLTDERATKAAIIDRLGWLLNGVRAGDRILFYYSGHGAQFPLRNPQGNVDEMHETICPIDFNWTVEHAIFDTEFQKIFSAVPEGVGFIWGSDSCYSGGLLKALYKKQIKVKTFIAPADIAWRIRTAKAKNINFLGIQKAMETVNVALIAGCTADQTSSDGYFDNKYNGALTYFLLKELQKENGLRENLITLVNNVAETISQYHDYPQTPQLLGNKEIESKPFLS